jgi:hypothetical protein
MTQTSLPLVVTARLPFLPSARIAPSTFVTVSHVVTRHITNKTTRSEKIVFFTHSPNHISTATLDVRSTATPSSLDLTSLRLLNSSPPPPLPPSCCLGATAAVSTTYCTGISPRLTMTDLCYNCLACHLPNPCPQKLAQCGICYAWGHQLLFCPRSMFPIPISLRFVHILPFSRRS